MSKPVTAIIVGAGHRSLIYASLAELYPDKLKIVGVADPDDAHREQAVKRFHIAPDMIFHDAEELAAHPRLADAIINGTMDQQHVPTSIPLLKLGYDMLLEKPFCVNEEEMWELYAAAEKYGNKVMICHVLRYAPFYVDIKKRLAAGEIGDIINIQLTEHVAYHHLVVSFVRGKWRSEKVCFAPMLLAKCCHDMDLMMWLMGDDAPTQIASFGSNFAFAPEKMPDGAGNRCLVDCPKAVEEACPYSAQKHYIDHPDRWFFYVWDQFIGKEPAATIDEKIEALKTDNMYGKCVWKCGHDNVDHQSVLVNFESGATGTLNMIGGTAKAERNIHIIGTKGEIKGIFDDSVYEIRRIHQAPGEEPYTTEVVDLKIGGDKSGMTGSHGGGDLRLVDDFVDVCRGETPSISSTSLSDSIRGHLAVFCAEESRKNGTVVSMKDRFKK